MQLTLLSLIGSILLLQVIFTLTAPVDFFEDSDLVVPGYGIPILLTVAGHSYVVFKTNRNDGTATLLFVRDKDGDVAYINMGEDARSPIGAPIGPYSEYQHIHGKPGFRRPPPPPPGYIQTPIPIFLGLDPKYEQLHMMLYKDSDVDNDLLRELGVWDFIEKLEPGGMYGGRDSVESALRSGMDPESGYIHLVRLFFLISEGEWVPPTLFPLRWWNFLWPASLPITIGGNLDAFVGSGWMLNPYLQAEKCDVIEYLESLSSKLPSACPYEECKLNDTELRWIKTQRFLERGEFFHSNGEITFMGRGENIISGVGIKIDKGWPHNRWLWSPSLMNDLLYGKDPWDWAKLPPSNLDLRNNPISLGFESDLHDSSRPVNGNKYSDFRMPGTMSPKGDNPWFLVALLEDFEIFAITVYMDVPPPHQELDDFTVDILREGNVVWQHKSPPGSPVIGKKMIDVNHEIRNPAGGEPKSVDYVVGDSVKISLNGFGFLFFAKVRVTGRPSLPGRKIFCDVQPL